MDLLVFFGFSHFFRCVRFRFFNCLFFGILLATPFNRISHSIFGSSFAAMDKLAGINKILADNDDEDDEDDESRLCDPLPPSIEFGQLDLGGAVQVQ